MLKHLVFVVLAVIGAALIAPKLIRADGPRATHTLAAAVETPAAADRPGSATLRADPDGHFRVDATIGGRSLPMLVDTGATAVALSYEHAERLGLARGGDRFDVSVSTANGIVGAKRVVLRDLRVGGVTMTDVTALVMPRGAMDGNLLGMSFLGRLRRMETIRDRLVMER